VDLWVETLAGWAQNLGADAFIFWPSQPGIREIERFAEEVVPRVRAAVG
jgi:hypothetical protein